jgi:hypothetical protein
MAVILDKKTIWALLNIGLIGMLAGGLVTVVVADFIKTPTPAAIGQLTSPSSIKSGDWFRYDMPPSAIPTFVPYTNWSLTGGLPYIVIECTNVTTFADIKDPSATDGGSKLAYQWKIMPYWQNGVVATELLNGSIVNDVWELVLKQIYTGQFPIANNSPAELLRPWVDTSLSNWSNTQSATRMIQGLQTYFQWVGAITDVQQGFSQAIHIGSDDYKYGHVLLPGEGGGRTLDMIPMYDADTHILYTLLFYDVSGPVGYAIGRGLILSLSGYSDGINFKGKQPPAPAPLSLSVNKVDGQAYEYALSIIGTFSRAHIVIKSNDTSGLTNSSFDTTESIIPIDIHKPVDVTIAVNGTLYGRPINTTTIKATLADVNPAGKSPSVTLLSATRIGNSFNVTWTAESHTKSYWVMLNDTYLTSTNDTSIVINPPLGTWNITIVTNNPYYNETSDPSNGIIVVYSVLSSNLAPTNTAGDPTRTDITPGISIVTIAIWVIVPVAALTAVVIFIFLIRIGKIHVAMKLPTRKGRSPATTTRKK